MCGILVLCQVFTKDSKHNRKNLEKPNPSFPCPVDFLDDMGGCTHIACVQPHERYPCDDVTLLSDDCSLLLACKTHGWP